MAPSMIAMRWFNISPRGCLCVFISVLHSTRSNTASASLAGSPLALTSTVFALLRLSEHLCLFLSRGRKTHLQRHQQVFLAHDHGGGVQARELEPMPVRDCIGGAGLDAVAAEDAAVVVDVVDLRVPLGGADALLRRVLGGFDVDAVRGTGCRAQKAGDAFFQAIFIALKLVLAAEALLKDRAAQRPFAVRIVLHLGRLKAFTERDAHSLRDGSRISQNRHMFSIRLQPE